MPCADTDSTFENETVSIHNENHSDTEPQHHDDTCSPFCSCNCCNTSGFYKVNPNFGKFIIIAQVTPENKTEYTSALLSNFHNSIWQPPQIS
jgi:hypothetical protein